MGNEQMIDKFVKEYTIVNNIKKKRVYKYHLFLGKLNLWLSKPFDKVNKNDLIVIYDKIRQSKELSDNSKDDFVKIIKTFGRHQKKKWDVEWMKANFSKNNGVLSNQLLTQEEIRAMTAAGNIMERTLVMVLYEMGCRLGELRSIQLQHCEFNGGGYARVTLPVSKTITRTLPIVVSVPYLREMVNQHPFKENQQAYLFCKQRPDKPLSDTAIRKMLVKLAKKAGITKRIWPHLLRHSRASAMAAYNMNEPLMRQMFGWSANSRVPGRYIHLSSKDLDDYILAKSGLTEIKREIKDEKLLPKQCGRCSKENPSVNKICYNCSWPLTQEAMMERDKVEGQIAEFLSLPGIKEQAKKFLIAKQM